jgi:hypothetical protein
MDDFVWRIILTDEGFEEVGFGQGEKKVKVVVKRSYWNGAEGRRREVRRGFLVLNGRPWTTGQWNSSSQKLIVLSKSPLLSQF